MTEGASADPVVTMTGAGEPGIDAAETPWRIAAHPEGGGARQRPMLAVDWTEPLLYDLVIDTKTIGVMTAVWWVPGPIGEGHVRLAGVLEPETVFRRPIR